MMYMTYSRKCESRILVVMVDYFIDATLVDLNAIVRRMRQALRSGQLTREQFDDLRSVGIVAQGTPIAGGEAMLAVIEASVSIGRRDVYNAQRRAGIIQGLMGRTTGGFCASHYRWSDDLADVAAALGVELIHCEWPGFDIP